MTEQEWLERGDLLRMVRWLRGKASDRKLRLFACACCHRIGHLFADRGARIAVRVAERFAEGEATPEQLRRARKVALVASLPLDDESAAAWAAHAAARAAAKNAWCAARWAATDAQLAGCAAYVGAHQDRKNMLSMTYTGSTALAEHY